ncbi:MAG: BatA domain-containing protein [Spirochaetes bacterium]|nr:BatA domain-containing protein [Spirochaetota bacterium]
MVFTAPHLLYGLIFTLVPLIIHIIAKRRIKIIKFPSIMFLEKAAEKQAKRYKIRDLLLLILRMLVILFLVISIARPVKYEKIHKGGSAYLKGKRKSIVMIIDNSISMGQIISGESLLNTAKRSAEKIIKSQLKEGDNISVILTSDKNPIKFYDLTYNIDSALDVIRQSRVSYLRTDIFKALEAAETVLESSLYPTRIIYFITDLQKINFLSLQGDFINTTFRLKYPVTLINLKTAGIKNSSIPQTRLPQVLHFVGDKVMIRPFVKNFSDQQNNLILKMFLNKEPFGQKTASLGGGQSLWLDFENQIKQSGYLYGLAEIADGDNLLEDNRNYFTFYIPQNITIGFTEQKNELFFILNALNPSFILDHNSPSSINLQPTGLDKPLSGLDILLLSKNTLNGNSKNLISQFIRNKKSLLIIPPEDMDIDNFNEIFAKTHLLPGSIQNRVQSDKDNPLNLEFIDYSHPCFEIFESYKSFKNINIFHYFKFNVELSSMNTRVLARFSNGDPAIIEHLPFATEVIDSGKIILFLFSLVPDSTDMVYHPTFPPLIHQTVKYLSRPALLLTLNKFQVGNTVEDVKNILEIQEKKIEVKCLTDEIEKTLSGDTIIAPGIFKINQFYFAANMDYTESDLRQMNVDELKENYQNIPFILFESEADVDSRIVSGMLGKPYGQLFLFIALLLLLFELFIANQWMKILTSRFKLLQRLKPGQAAGTGQSYSE